MDGVLLVVTEKLRQSSLKNGIIPNIVGFNRTALKPYVKTIKDEQKQDIFCPNM